MLQSPTGSEHFRIEVDPLLGGESVVWFPIKPMIPGAEQLHHMCLRNLIDKDYIRSFQLLVIRDEPRPPQTYSGRPITLLAQADTYDTQKNDRDEYDLRFLWDAPILLDKLNGYTLWLKCNTALGQSHVVVRQHPNGNRLKLIIDVAAHLSQERRMFAQNPLGPFPYITYPLPNMYEIWYADGGMLLRQAKAWTKGPSSGYIFDDEPLFPDYYSDM